MNLFRTVLVFALCLPLSAAAATYLFHVTDIRGDDHGAGDIVYPDSSDYGPGDLDLLAFGAERVSKGTRFFAEFKSSLKDPAGLITEGGPEPISKFAKHGFYTLNVDVYIDSDRAGSSGKTVTVPGRDVTIAPEFAWEKAIIVTPRPKAARQLLESHMLSERERNYRANEGKLSPAIQREQAALAADDLASSYYMPERLRVRKNRLEFFVPDSFLGGPPKPDWGYTVIVTGADIEQRTSLLGRGEFSLLMRGIGAGRPQHLFGLADYADPGQPPVVDMLSAEPGAQEKALGSYNPVAGTQAVITGIVPSGRYGIAARQETKRPTVAARKRGAEPRSPDVQLKTESSFEAPRSFPDRLRDVRRLYDDGLISEAEYLEIRRRILSEL